jgi:predicted RNase H-like HicB family nuclease
MSAESCYNTILYGSSADQAVIAELAELPGRAADSETYAQALENVPVIAAEWIETARSTGREIPKPRGRLTFA